MFTYYLFKLSSVDCKVKTDVQLDLHLSLLKRNVQSLENESFVMQLNI